MTQVVRSYLLKQVKHIFILRIWDHTGALLKVTKMIKNDTLKLLIIKACYFILQFFLPSLGNKMIGIVIKKNLHLCKNRQLNFSLLFICFQAHE